MLDKQKLAPAAKLAFQKQIHEKVEWVATKCWLQNLESYIRGLSDVIGAGLQLEVTSGRAFSDDEIATYVTNLGPLKTLDMTTEIRDYLVQVLRDHGVEVESLISNK